MPSIESAAPGAQINTLPLELVEQIGQHLDGRTLLNLARTCRNMDHMCASRREEILLKGVRKAVAKVVSPRHLLGNSPQQIFLQRDREITAVLTLGTYRVYRRAVDVEHHPLKRAMYGALSAPAIVAGISTFTALTVTSLVLGAIPALLSRNEQPLFFLLAAADTCFGSMSAEHDTKDGRRIRHIQRRALRQHLDQMRGDITAMKTAPFGDEMATKVAEELASLVIQKNDKLDLRMRKPHNAMRR